MAIIKNHGNLQACQPKNVQLLPLLIIVLFPLIKCYGNSNFCLVFKGSCLKLLLTELFFIVYELDTWSRNLNSDFTLKDCLFGGVKLTKRTDPDKYVYSGYDIGFNSRSRVSLPDISVSKNVIIFELI